MGSCFNVNSNDDQSCFSITSNNGQCFEIKSSWGDCTNKYFCDDYDDGYKDGYEDGYSDIVKKQAPNNLNPTNECMDAYNRGQKDGYEDGANDNYTNSYNSSYDDSASGSEPSIEGEKCYREGYNGGYNGGYNDSNIPSTQSNYNEGIVIALIEGFKDGYVDGQKDSKVYSESSSLATSHSSTSLAISSSLTYYKYSFDDSVCDGGATQDHIDGCKEGYPIGYDKGYDKGKLEGQYDDEGYDKGYDDANNTDYIDGYKDGYRDGFNKGQIEIDDSYNEELDEIYDRFYLKVKKNTTFDTTQLYICMRPVPVSYSDKAFSAFFIVFHGKPTSGSTQGNWIAQFTVNSYKGQITEVGSVSNTELLEETTNLGLWQASVYDGDIVARGGESGGTGSFVIDPRMIMATSFDSGLTGSEGWRYDGVRSKGSPFNGTLHADGFSIARNLKKMLREADSQIWTKALNADYLSGLPDDHCYTTSGHIRSLGGYALEDVSIFCLEGDGEETGTYEWKFTNAFFPDAYIASPDGGDIPVRFCFSCPDFWGIDDVSYIYGKYGDWVVTKKGLVDTGGTPREDLLSYQGRSQVSAGYMYFYKDSYSTLSVVEGENFIPFHIGGGGRGHGDYYNGKYLIISPQIASDRPLVFDLSNKECVEESNPMCMTGNNGYIQTTWKNMESDRLGEIIIGDLSDLF